MKFKKLALLLVVLAILGAASIAKRSDLEKEDRASSARTTPQTESPLPQGFSTGFVTKIDLRRGPGDAEKIVFSKDADGAWTIEPATPARKEGVEALLKSLAELRGEVRAESEDVFDDFFLTDETAFHFRLSGADGSELAHLLLSPLRPRGTRNFARAAGSPKVLVTDTDILASLGIFSKEDRLAAGPLIDTSKQAPAAPTTATPAQTTTKKETASKKTSSFVKPKSG